MYWQKGGQKGRQRGLQKGFVRRNGRRRLWPLLLVAMLMFLALPVSALAEEGTSAGKEVSAGPVAQEGIPVELGKVIVLRIHHGTPELSPYERAAEITRRLYDAVWWHRQNGTLNPDQVRVAVAQGEPVIYLGDRLIVTVDQAHASSNFSSLETLAREWAENLKAAITAYMELLK